MLALSTDASVEPVIFTKGKEVHRRPTSIHHWQLRDLLSAADNEYEFYCLYDQTVYRYSAKTKQSSVVTNLEFAANSMTCRHQYVAAGGMQGELEVREMADGQVCFKGAVGTTVNNALHIASLSSGEHRLFVCCNDSTIKVYKLPGMEGATTIRCPAPINYAALSPDGSHLVAVGDCDPTLIYQATPTGYTLLTSFTEACDVGMCCCWNHHGTLFASCHQDGAVAVWDQRSGACVARLALASAARCIKFSPAPLDLLAVSEHEDRVCLVDARCWGRRQVLAASQDAGAGLAGSPARASRPVDVSGIAFTPSVSQLGAWEQ
eukprot:GHRR01018778.1.p1 GENE.GHRR01018778.1~~GHRR01018778.1.p1  ORF type:complete len:320 (+),score=107.99 GHRR01018778.1:118-1077(+)